MIYLKFLGARIERWFLRLMVAKQERKITRTLRELEALMMWWEEHGYYRHAKEVKEQILKDMAKFKVDYEFGHVSPWFLRRFMERVTKAHEKKEGDKRREANRRE